MGDHRSCCAAMTSTNRPRIKELALPLPKRAWRTITWRETMGEKLPHHLPVCVRVAHRVTGSPTVGRRWLLIEWPDGEKEPIGALGRQTVGEGFYGVDSLADQPLGCSCRGQGNLGAIRPIWGPTGRPYVRASRVMALLNSRSHSTELATAVQYSQSPKLKAVVENACCRKGT